MSLIIEALKRARDDAIRRQAASKGLPLAPIPRMRSRSRWLSFALVPLVAALVVCILLLIDLYSRLPRSAERVEDPTSATTASVTPVADLSAGSTVEETHAPATTAMVESVATEPDLAASQSGSPQAVQNSTPVPVSEPRATQGPAAAVPTRTQEVLPRPSSPPVQTERSQMEREFVGQAELLDGQLVDLEGIAWSESEPFALLNGQVIGVGEMIRAYRVAEISQSQVVLEQGDDRIVLRLK